MSESLIESIHLRNIGPSQAAAEKYLSEDPEPFVKSYIHARITRYRIVLAQLQSGGPQSDDTYMIAILLWNQELFFEVHEWLENRWHTATGVEKKVIQALVRSAGTYVHLELGRMGSARKIGAKALAGLVEQKSSIPDMIDADLLIKKVKILDPAPPKLGALPKPENGAQQA